MSTNNECLVVEVERDKWYYVLEDYSAPKNAWDWRENATGYGPFPTQDAATDHLGKHHANPGGHFVDGLPEGQDKRDLSKDAVLRRLIEDAPKNTRALRASLRW
jgi:hypothetical protein